MEGDDNGPQALGHLSGEMVPNSDDDDPFVRCTANKDLFKVRKEQTCK